MIKIKVGGPQATVELQARKALDGSLPVSYTHLRAHET